MKTFFIIKIQVLVLLLAITILTYNCTFASDESNSRGSTVFAKSSEVSSSSASTNLFSSSDSDLQREASKIKFVKKQLTPEQVRIGESHVKLLDDFIELLTKNPNRNSGILPDIAKKVDDLGGSYSAVLSLITMDCETYTDSAVRKNDITFIKFLLDADLMPQSLISRSLDLALQNEEFEIASMLVPKLVSLSRMDLMKRMEGIFLSRKGYETEPFMRFAVQKNNVACIKFLLDADIIPLNLISSLLVLALKIDKFEIASMLASTLTPLDRNNKYRNQIMKKIFSWQLPRDWPKDSRYDIDMTQQKNVNSIKRIKFLLDYGVNVNIKLKLRIISEWDRDTVCPDHNWDGEITCTLLEWIYNWSYVSLHGDRYKFNKDQKFSYSALLVHNYNANISGLLAIDDEEIINGSEKNYLKNLKNDRKKTVYGRAVSIGSSLENYLTPDLIRLVKDYESVDQI